MKSSGRQYQALAGQIEDVADISMFSDGRGSRAALLAGASLTALAALGAPGAARACNGADQTISMVVSGPIFSTDGTITVLSSGTINGGPDGVDASSCSITIVSNSGALSGGLGGPGEMGGAGVSNAGTIKTLTNNDDRSAVAQRGDRPGVGHADAASWARAALAAADLFAAGQHRDRARVLDASVARAA
jgi:hypothetical protein